MKKIIYTQRVEIVESYHERRDCADVEIAGLIWACGYLPIPVNNIPQKVNDFLEQIKPDGIIFTGGNDLAKYGGNAPERDETERSLIAYGMTNKIPMYGFCRGMQMIADYCGAELIRVDNHVAVRHSLNSNDIWNGRVVNSFHNMAVKDATDELIVTARAEDGIIEAIQVKGQEIYATMWHPEREKPYAEQDMQFIRQIFS